MEVRLQHRTPSGVIERLVFEPSGLLRVTGYTLAERAEIPLRLEVQGLEGEQRPLFVGRTHRLDLKGDLHAADEFLGWEAEFQVGGLAADAEIALLFEGQFVWRGCGERFPEPPYAHLFEVTEPLGRDAIYGVGPPIQSVPPVIGALLKDARGPLLDFGCGSGALVRHLRGRGVEANGLEVDCSMIRDSLREDVQPFVRLYDGSLPSPYADGAFQTVTAIEVVEHLPDPGRYVAELARLTRGEALITVPDISAVPRCAPLRVVPWHLLEATHVNFFTPRSLEALLRRHFAEVELFRIEPVDLNGVRFFTNIGARCRHR
ncbi:MAG: class I SAM-dependent methyltransferase [Verrucomicrobia bacterium]|nr:class I SAM-dependent methyltransferase [Verrucomicrobiota bacterium]